MFGTKLLSDINMRSNSYIDTDPHPRFRCERLVRDVGVQLTVVGSLNVGETWLWVY